MANDPATDPRREAFAQTIPGEELSPEAARAHAERIAELARHRATEPAPPIDGGERLARRLGRGGGEGPRLALGATLGSGATATVFAARDADLDREVAVKVLGGEAAARADDVDAFVAEARTTAALSHPGIVPVHEIDLAADGRPYFTMARVAGRTLADAIEASRPERRDGRIGDPPAVARVFIAVGNALAYAHHRGVVHQDVKPANILLGDFGEVLLLDWGSAARHPSGRAARLYGTPLYMSPEQARREASTPASDVYCLGATLFHALTLRVPTWRDDADEFWRLKAAGAIDPPTRDERRACPPELLAIALKCLAARAEDRYAGADEVVADLNRWQSGLAVSAWREPLWRLLARWYAHNRRVAWWTMAAATVIILAVGALWREKLKERSDWCQVYASHFERDGVAGLARDWIGKHIAWDGGFVEEPITADRCRWTIDGDRVVAHVDDAYADLVFRRPLRGDLRVEWSYAPLGVNENMNCFISGDDRRSGYTFHVGGWNDPTLVVLTRGSEDYRLAEVHIAALEVGHAYRFLMERVDDRLRLAIDGRVIVDCTDVDDLHVPYGQRFGFDCCFGNIQSIADVRVWHRPPPEKQSPLTFAADLYRLGHFRDAARAFAELADAYRGTAYEPESAYGRGMSLLAAGERADAVEVLRGFVDAFPRHRRAPNALHALIGVELAADDAARAAADDEALLAFPGHPILTAVRDDRVAASRRRIDPLKADFHGERLATPAALERALAEVAELRAWSARHGVPDGRDELAQDAAWLAHALGRDDLVSGLVRPGSHVAIEALRHQGRYDEMARFPDWPHAFVVALDQGDPRRALSLVHDGWNRADAAADLDAPELVVDDPLMSSTVKMIALTRCGRGAELTRLFPERGDWLARAADAAGRPEDALAALDASPADDPGERITALLGLGRLAQAWDLVRDPQRRMNRQLEAGRIAMEALARGDDALADAILGELRALPELYGDPSFAFARYLLPALREALAGRRIDLAAAWASGPTARRDVLFGALWHDAAFIAGRIDEAAYRAQPYRRHLEARLAFAIAIRADVAGDCAGALASYRRAQAARPADALGIVERRFRDWRIAVLSGR